MELRSASDIVVVGSKYVTEGIQQYLYAMNASHDERFDVRIKLAILLA
jgi:hypothetical protein